MIQVAQVYVRANKKINVTRLCEIGNSSVFKRIEEGANVKSAYLESVGARSRIEMIITT